MESQRYELHAEKVSNTAENSKVISAFKIDIPTILKVMGEGKYSSTPLMAIHTTEMWNVHDRARGFFQIESKSLHYQIIELQSAINLQFQMHTEARLLSSKMLRKCGVFWSQMKSKV